MQHNLILFLFKSKLTMKVYCQFLFHLTIEISKTIVIRYHYYLFLFHCLNISFKECNEIDYITSMTIGLCRKILSGKKIPSISKQLNEGCKTNLLLRTKTFPVSKSSSLIFFLRGEVLFPILNLFLFSINIYIIRNRISYICLHFR